MMNVRSMSISSCARTGWWNHPDPRTRLASERGTDLSPRVDRTTGRETRKEQPEECQAGAADNGTTEHVTLRGQRDATAGNGLAAQVVVREEEVGSRRERCVRPAGRGGLAPELGRAERGVEEDDRENDVERQGAKDGRGVGRGDLRLDLLRLTRAVLAGALLGGLRRGRFVIGVPAILLRLCRLVLVGTARTRGSCRARGVGGRTWPACWEGEANN